MTDNGVGPASQAKPAASDEYVQAIINTLQNKLNASNTENITIGAKLEVATKLITTLTTKVDEQQNEIEALQENGVAASDEPELLLEKPKHPVVVSIKEGDKAPKS